MEKATFGGGCFWGVEATFRQLKGVTATAVGYEGGTLAHPTYRDVCSHTTGHAEVVQVESIRARLPINSCSTYSGRTTIRPRVTGKGPMSVRNIRSVIFYHSPQQKEAAIAFKKRLTESGKFRRPIVTEIVPAGDFWRAEDYHQQYILAGHCRYIGGKAVMLTCLYLLFFGPSHRPPADSAAVTARVLGPDR